MCVFFPFFLLSELPEREEGEGEETPNFSHWGPPRMYVDDIIGFLNRTMQLVALFFNFIVSFSHSLMIAIIHTYAGLNFSFILSYLEIFSQQND